MQSVQHLKQAAATEEDAGESEQAGPYHREMLKNFRDRAINAARVFATRAAEEGIPFRHVVESGDVGSCVRKMEREINRLQFVLEDAESVREVVRHASIPVFAIGK